MQPVWLAIEYLWVHFAVYARAIAASVRQVHDELGLNHVAP